MNTSEYLPAQRMSCPNCGCDYPAAPGRRLRAVPPSPAGADSPAELIAVVRELLTWADSPSLRAIEIRSRNSVRRSTLSDALNHPERLPKRDLLRAVVTACQAEEHWPEWEEVWTRLDSAQPRPAPTPRRKRRSGRMGSPGLIGAKL